MEMTGERRIPAPRDKVWQALNDPAVLKDSLPGCEFIEAAGDNQYNARLALKIGPLYARFSGTVTLSDIDPAERLHAHRRGPGRRRRLRQGHGPGAARRGRPRRHRPHLST
ncbi:MAG: SRPBCC domain-containing protein [Acetobacteraceae bacterium]|nr:SRPBCC domain-containing protein [Acetobacteraceae bacterium]